MSQFSRRDLLRAGLSAAAGLATRGSMLGMLGGGLASAAQAATGDYKALVCVFLYGGNDGYNVLVPTDSARYQTYKTTRSSLALPTSGLLQLSNAAQGSSSLSYGVPTTMPGLQSLYSRGRLAFVANVGTLVAPTTKADFQAKRNLPPQLFSHNDQQGCWMATQSDAAQRTGWAGRLSELMGSVNANRELSMNVSIGSSNYWQTGPQSMPYVLGQNGVVQFKATLDGRASQRSAVFNQMLAQAQTPTAFYTADVTARSMSLGAEVGQALSQVPAFSTTYPSSTLSSQLQLVAKMIAARSSLSMSRQVFFVSLGGFDTHDGQSGAQPGLLSQVSQAMSAFDANMEELGLGQQVTTFTASDFGRSLTSNGDGSDHGWGNVQWVSGGAVAGGRVYGSFPNQAVGSSDDAGGGRMIPTTSVEQYGATLLRWFGAAEDDIHTVFPNLDRFASSDLGFV